MHRSPNKQSNGDDMNPARSTSAGDGATGAARPTPVNEDAAPRAPDAPEMDGAFFSFPFEPYDIQLALMRQLWQTIDNRHIGIFESPTGTGKSMSLICGILTWLTKHTDDCGLPTALDNSAAPGRTTDAANASSHEPAEPSWLACFDEQTAAKAADERRQRVETALRPIATIRADPVEQGKKRKMAFAYNHHERKRPSQRPQRRQQEVEVKLVDDGEAAHLVDAYDSGSDQRPIENNCGQDEDPRQSRRHGQDAQQFGIAKIIYCSRTHSQITQFVREIKKTAFHEHIRVISLGSRKNLCVNEQVTGLRSDLRMTDKCLDMLQGSKKRDQKGKTTKCPFYNSDLIDHYKDYALAHVQDIEELHTLGEDMSICSYYGSRASIPLAQVVAMPYSMLLSKNTRESLGIDVNDAVVVFDEAHNIVEAINSTHQVEVSNRQLVVCRRSLWSYFNKYEKRLRGKNTFYIKQVLSILEAMVKYLRKCAKESNADPKIMSINDFVFSAGIDHFNMFKIVQYLSQSDLAKKLLGFVEWEKSETLPSEEASSEGAFESKHLSPLRVIESLLESLTNATSDGRILVHPHMPAKGTEGQIKFVLLNPANHFEDIVYKARSIILAGGTMQPVSQVIDQLFPGVPPSRIDLFSCGHVIPPENLIGVSLSSGPSQQHLEFTYTRRDDMDMMDELGRVLMNLVRIIPRGVVVFFPSYRFEDSAICRWMETKQLAQLNAKKVVFREPKTSDQLGSVLDQYSATCRTPPEGSTGAILMSVVGGKMSEGINFSDDLARCVVMVGLPYPNARDPELVEKMEFLNTRQPGSGRLFYDSLCMKAVNQSIGRSIRHQNDYASIVLIDHRYSSPHIRGQLPRWIQHRVQPPCSFGQAYARLVQFFRSKHAST